MRLSAVVYVVYLLLLIYVWLIVAGAVLSWFRVRPGSPISQVKRAVSWLTEPYLRLFRRFLPIARIGSVGLDLSALVGLIVLFILIQVLARL
jgi:YggT family protein